MLIRRAKTIEMMELNVRIWPAIATVTLNVSPMSINSSPESKRDIIEVSADITSVSIIRIGRADDLGCPSTMWYPNFISFISPLTVPPHTRAEPNENEIIIIFNIIRSYTHILFMVIDMKSRRAVCMGFNLIPQNAIGAFLPQVGSPPGA